MSTYLIFMVFSLVTLIVKHNHVIYVLLSMECLVVALLVGQYSGLESSTLVVLFVNSVLSSVSGFLVLINLMSSYGSEGYMF